MALFPVNSRSFVESVGRTMGAICAGSFHHWRSLRDSIHHGDGVVTGEDLVVGLRRHTKDGGTRVRACGAAPRLANTVRKESVTDAASELRIWSGDTCGIRCDASRCGVLIRQRHDSMPTVSPLQACNGTRGHQKRGSSMCLADPTTLHPAYF